jgi:hypothetical protein
MEMKMRTASVWSLVAIAVVATACSSSDSSSSSPSADAYCAAEAAVKDSYDTLIATDVVAEGTDTLKRRFEAFTTDLASLETAAGSRFSSQVDAVQGSVDQLEKVIRDAGSVGIATTAERFSAGLGDLKTSVEALFTEVDRACEG